MIRLKNIDGEKLIPKSVDNCLSLWCYHCYYYKSEIDKCITPSKREEEDEYKC